LAAALHAVHDKYGAEDKLKAAAGGATSPTPDDMQQEVYKLMAAPEYKDFRDSKHEATVAKVRELCQKIAAAKSAKK
jgi:hypothetical protein